MTAVPEKLRTGLVELRTPLGSVYVTPSFWQRVYLVWTFRNFRTLPKQVLNRRQQHVIENLCRAPILSRTRPLGTSLIGAVENVGIPKLKPDSSPATITAVVTNVSPAAAPGINQTRWKLLERRIADADHLFHRCRFIGHAAVTHLAGVEAQFANRWRKLQLRQPPTWVLVTSVVALLGALSYFQSGRRSQRVGAAQAKAHASVSADVPPPVVASVHDHARAVLESSQSAQFGKVKTARSSSATVAPAEEEGRRQVQHAALRQPFPSGEDATTERLEIVGPPQAGFGYPEAPNPKLTGRVDLRAVIAADGTVKGVDVLSGNRALAAAAARAVRLWRYRAPEVNGHAVEAETKIVISFVGDDAVSVRFPSDPQNR